MKKTKTTALASLPKTATSKTSIAVVAASIQKKAQPKSKKVLDIEIKTKDDRALVMATVKEIKEMVKEAQVSEAKILDPLKTAMEETKNLFKPFYDSAKLVEKIGKDKILAFDEKATIAATALTKQLETGKIKKVSTFMNKLQEVEASTEGVRVTKEIIVEDIAKVPREFLVPDMVAIKAAFKDGKKVAGCKEVEKKGLTI